MQRLESFADKRLLARCIFCRGGTESKEHVPSKVFLDKPHPENHPTINICNNCNSGFSLDEQYVACLIECACIGSADPDNIQREKIKKTLKRSPALATKLQHAFIAKGAGKEISIEEKRLKNVIMKIARGLVAYELEEPTLYSPTSFEIAPLQCLSLKTREAFEAPVKSSMWPEIGSRAMLRMVLIDDNNRSYINEWIELQPGRFRYLTSVGRGISIRFVISEYLACEVLWP